MKILSVEISGDDVLMVSFDGTIENFKIGFLGKIISLPKGDNSIKAYIDLQKNLSLKLQEIAPLKVILCEGGFDSRKKRVRIEYSLLCECENLGIDFKTYSTSTCSKLINSGFEKKTNISFDDYYDNFDIPKYAKKVFIAGWRFLNGN